MHTRKPGGRGSLQMRNPPINGPRKKKFTHKSSHEKSNPLPHKGEGVIPFGQTCPFCLTDPSPLLPSVFLPAPRSLVWLLPPPSTVKLFHFLCQVCYGFFCSSPFSLSSSHLCLILLLLGISLDSRWWMLPRSVLKQ